jgi:hypothetical protein
VNEWTGFQWSGSLRRKGVKSRTLSKTFWVYHGHWHVDCCMVLRANDNQVRDDKWHILNTLNFGMTTYYVQTIPYGVLNATQRSGVSLRKTRKG